jgi:hypothetical protein
VLASLALVVALSAPADAQAAPRLFVYGDSLGYQTKKYLPNLLSDWRVRQHINFGWRVRDAVRALAQRRSPLARVVHVSVGTSDDPSRTRPFRRRVRRIMRIVGAERCVVWANLWRPAPPGEPGWTRFNRVLAEEADRRRNLIVVDWHSMVKANQDWLVYDDVHVFPPGARARARAVARAARTCRERVTAEPPTTAQ